MGFAPADALHLRSMPRVGLTPALPLPLISYLPGQRERQSKGLGEIRSGGNLADHIADPPAQDAADSNGKVLGNPWRAVKRSVVHSMLDHRQVAFRRMPTVSFLKQGPALDCLV